MAKPVEQEKWYEDFGNLLDFASILNDTGEFHKPEEVLYFFEKPWKWDRDYEIWEEAGKPGEDDTEEWEKFVDALNETRS